MSFVFGDTIICDDAQTAKMLAFHRDVHARCVTMQGDVYDPSGTMSGGAAPQGSGILVKAQELVAAQNKLRESQARLQHLQAEEQRVAHVREQWKNAARTVEVKEHEVRLLEEQLAGSNASRVSRQVHLLNHKPDPFRACRSAHRSRISRNRSPTSRRNWTTRRLSNSPQRPTFSGLRKTWPSLRTTRKARPTSYV